MIESIELVCRLVLRSWQLWGCMVFLVLPAGLVVVVAWDFADWRSNRKDREP